MRWRFVDRIDRFKPWNTIHGVKSVSFEEYSLLKPFGRKGILPETIALEGVVQLARWLVIKSSDYQQACQLSCVDGFAFDSEAVMGESLKMSIMVKDRTDEFIDVECESSSGGRKVCGGRLVLELTPLGDAFEPDALQAMWQELHDKA